LLYLPYLVMCALVDFVKVLAKAVQKPPDFLRDACHSKKLVRLVDILAGCAGAPAAKPVDQVPRLVRPDTTSQVAQFLGAVDQLGTLCVLCLCCAVEVLRLGQSP
jgi:hypothetical protein